MLEGTFRSLNSLQERFHQSFFFYLLPRTQRYISIGVYMPPFGLIVIGLLIQALSLWLDYTKEREEYLKQKKEKENEEKSKHSPTSIEEKKKPKTIKKSGDLDISPWWEIAPYLVITGVFAVCAGSGAAYFLRAARPFRIDPGRGLLGGCSALLSAAMALPWFYKRKAKDNVFVKDWRLMKCIALLGLILFLGCLGVLNVSMAMFLAVPLVPVSLLVRPVKNWFFRILLMCLLLAVSPLAFPAGGCFLHSYLTFGNAEAAFFSTSTCLQHTVLQCWVEKELLGSWTFSIATQMLFPTWILFWSLPWAQ